MSLCSVRKRVMAFPAQSFLFQPSVSLALRSSSSPSSSSSSFSSRFIPGCRSVELDRSCSSSSCRSAFAPYFSSAPSSAGFKAQLRLGGEPRSFEGPGFGPSSSYSSSPSSGSLEFHPLGALAPYPYGDPTYRKNATRDATATLKVWLNEHRKNPYPTKGEKIMLAIVTKMSLTQVSTWFANARRRLKKENKLTWTPRNRSEDEDEEDVDLGRHEDDDVTMKMRTDETETADLPLSSVGRCHPLTCRDGSTDVVLKHPDFTESLDRGPPPITGPAPTGSSPQHTTPRTLRPPEPDPTSSPPSEDLRGPGGSVQGPVSKPRLWSLAELAASSDKTPGSGDSSQRPTPPFIPRTLFPHSAPLPPHFYYTSALVPGYSNFAPSVSPLPPGPHLTGLEQTMLQRPEVTLGDDKVRSQWEVQELKTGMNDV